MVSKKVPKRLLDYGLVHQDGILSRITCGKTLRTGIEEVIVQTPVTSECLDFDFYDHAWWLDNNHISTTDDNIILGRWIGISQKNEISIFFWVLTVLGNFFAWTNSQHGICIYLLDSDMKGRIDFFLNVINAPIF